ncbi:MAG: nicotinate-nicotinamide nucleotide adenylyltransferase, partial [Oscillospiraceae bacterium]|nr:nicotinate-nicotinamide nucleotide adenylyltransferase [Oscillospiraceae bacterium]
MRRAIFGGSFDPVHKGHVSLASELQKALRLDEIIVMPTGISPFKKDMKRRPAGGLDRLEMCRLAFADMPFVTVSDYEVLQGGVSYTVDT